VIPLTYQQIMGLPDKSPIPAVTGRITSLYPQEQKNGDFGAYTTQNLIITDGSQKLRVSLQDHPPYGNEWQGQTIIITQGQNGKGQIGGVEASHYQSRQSGEMVYGVRVKKSGVINTGTQAPQQAPPQPPQQAYQQAPPQRPHAQQPMQAAHPQPAPASGNPVGNARKELGRIVTARLLCFDAAKYLVKQKSEDLTHMFGETLSADAFMALVNQLYMDGAKTGAFVGLPVKLDQETAPQQRQPPRPPPPPPPPQDGNDGFEEPPDPDDIPF